MTIRPFAAALVAVILACTPVAQRPAFSTAVRGFIMTDAAVIALTKACVSDGTGTLGTQADLVIINRDAPTTNADARNGELVFRASVGCHPARLIDLVSGRVGLW